MKKTNIPFCAEIPDTWREVPNKYLFSCHSVKVGSDWKNYQLLSLTTTGVKVKDINASGGKVPDSYDNYQTVEPGDMIFCLFDLDVSAVFSGLSNLNGMITSAYDVVKLNKTFVNQSFIDYWFRYVFSNRYYKIYSKNIRYTIGSDTFAQINTPVPTLKEQAIIGKYLDLKISEIDALIEKLNKEMDLLQLYKQSLINEKTINGLKPDIRSKTINYFGIKSIPQHWEFLRTGLIFIEKVRKPCENDLPLSLSQIDGLIPTTDMKENSLKSSSYENWKRVIVGDLVLNRFKAHLGVLFSSNYEGIVSFHYGVFKNKIAASSKFYEYLYHSDYYRSILGSYSNGMVLSLQNLSNSNFYKVKSVYPPENEQIKIVEFLDNKSSLINDLIRIKTMKIERLEEYKKSLIFECVTGKKEAVYEI